MRRLPLLVAGLFTLVVMISACGSAPPNRSQENVLTDVYITAYTWFDNTPQGSPDISHPVLHRAAGGTGTFSDPVTIAVGHSLETGKDVLDVPAGTRMYIPNVRRYFIVE